MKPLYGHHQQRPNECAFFTVTFIIEIRIMTTESPLLEFRLDTGNHFIAAIRLRIRINNTSKITNFFVCHQKAPTFQIFWQQATTIALDVARAIVANRRRKEKDRLATPRQKKRQEEDEGKTSAPPRRGDTQARGQISREGSACNARDTSTGKNYQRVRGGILRHASRFALAYQRLSTSC